MVAKWSFAFLAIATLGGQRRWYCTAVPFVSISDPGGSLSDTEDPDGEGGGVRGKASLALKSGALDAPPVVKAYFTSVPEDAESSDALGGALREMANAAELKEFLTTTRRSLHRHPELMYDLPVTSDTIGAALDGLGVPYTTGWAKNTRLDAYDGPGGYGLVAHVGTRRADQPCVILRADMDALPILEATKDVDSFRSQTPGKMHACGHDGHVTMLLGAAALLKKVEGEIEGTVRLVFQPAEEGGAGMKRMVEEGLVEPEGEPRAEMAFGMHVWPGLPSGVVASRPGPLMAATELFTIVLHGKGGHAAMPHLTIDPIVAASSLVVNLQSIISRTLSPLDSGVVSVTQVTAGESYNVIPAFATLKGTIRALSTEMVLSLRDRVAHIVESTASVHSCNYTITYMPDFYPPTVNDVELFEWSAGVGALVSREGKTRVVEPTMGGEDFAFLAEAVPSTFFFVGQGTGGDEKHNIPRTDYGLHHPSFALDEEVLPVGVELHANLALRSLKNLLSKESKEATKAEL